MDEKLLVILFWASIVGGLGLWDWYGIRKNKKEQIMLKGQELRSEQTVLNNLISLKEIIIGNQAEEIADLKNKLTENEHALREAQNKIFELEELLRGT